MAVNPPPPLSKNIVPAMLNTDFMRVVLFCIVQSALSVGAIVFVTNSVSWEQAIKQWAAVFCASMLTRISHASVVNGTITAGKIT